MAGTQTNRRDYMFRKMLTLVILALLVVAVSFGVASPSYAKKVTYKGYVLKGKCPPKDKCVRYQKTHKGAERWRLWVRRAAYKQARYKAKGTRNWRRVWNEDWVIKIIHRESRGQPNAGRHHPFWGLMQIWRMHVKKSPTRLFNGPFNINVGARLFASPTANGGPSPWASTTGGTGVSPYAPRARSK